MALRSTAAVFTYCRSRGLFAGISLEGSYLIERKETNRKFYSQDIRASAILNGEVEPPSECYDLYHILDAYAEAYTADWTSKNMRPKVSDAASSLFQPKMMYESKLYTSGDKLFYRKCILSEISTFLSLSPVVSSSIQTSSSTSAESSNRL